MQTRVLVWLAASGAAETEVGSAGSMLFACWAMLIVLLAMSFLFLRSGKKEYAGAILPLPLVPFFYIFSGPLGRLLDPVVSLDATMLRVMVVLTGGLLSCLLLGLAVRGITARRTRNAVFWCCAAFVVVVCLVLAANLLQAVTV